MQDYVALYLNSALGQQDPSALFYLMFLFLGRIVAVISLTPFLGSRVMPRPVKLAFGLSLFAVFLPQLLRLETQPLQLDTTLVLLFFKEIFIGVLLGFFISVPFAIVQSTGIYIDHQRGAASLMINDPTIQNQSSPLGTLFNLVLIVLFFMIDGPFTFLDLIAQSYDILPPDQFMNLSFFNLDGRFMQDITRLIGRIILITAQLAAPALIMILMTDVFLGIVNRMTPQVQITFLGMPLKSLLALFVVFVGWQLFTRQMVVESNTWLHYIKELIQAFKPI